MSKTKAPFIAQPLFVRPGVQEIVTQKRLDAAIQFNQQLLGLLVQHFPALKDQAAQLQQEYAIINGQIGSLEGQLALTGHGIRGVLFSQSITTEKKNKEFEDTFAKVPEKPLNGDQLVAALQQYLQINTITQNGPVLNWIFPDEKSFGNKVIQAKPDDDIIAAGDGLYVISEGQQASYTLKLNVGDQAILFSPRTGPSALTFSQVEQAWIQHSAFQFLDAERVLAAIEAFFSTTSIHDVSPAEFKKLYTKVNALPAAKLEGLARATGSKFRDFDLVINELFTARLPADAAGSITNARDDFGWTDLTLFTRRQLWRDLVSRVDAAASGSAPVAVAKKTAKKAVKKS